MFRSIFLLYLLITSTLSITTVPGIIDVELLPNNQVANLVYRPSTTVHYKVQFKDVPIDDQVSFGVEIRGSNPMGGPRGYIATAYNTTTITQFVKTTNNSLQFKLIPSNVYAGYDWFLRPFVFFANQSMMSTNMMNSGSSKLFKVLQELI